MPLPSPSRRDILQAGIGALAGAAMLRAARPAHADNHIFRHGVASGDPARNAIILWTRLSTERDESIGVEWRVSERPDLSEPAASGRAIASAEHDHTIHVDAKGLRPATRYFYGFRAQGIASPVGRARTLPDLNSQNPLRIAILSCSNHNAGYFNAYRAVAARNDLDAVLHLGDYIYEYPNNIYGNHPERGLLPPNETITLQDYRQRYALYHADPYLKVMRQRHPLIAIWDDHEIANDSWEAGAQNHQSDKEGAYADRQKAARRAFFEWLPIRGRHIYRGFRFGATAELIMLDTRHDGRARQLSYANFFRQGEKEGDPPTFDIKAFDEAMRDPSRRIFSAKQERFLRRRLRRNARWTLIGNQVAMTPFAMPDFSNIPNLPDLFKPAMGMRRIAEALKRPDLPVSLDPWEGYPVMRRRILDLLRRSGRAPLILTGDTHTAWAAALDGVGFEMGAPSVSSPSALDYAPEARAILERRVQDANPALLSYETRHRGYLLLELDAERAVGQWFQTDTKTPQSPVTRGARVEVRHDAPDSGRLI